MDEAALLQHIYQRAAVQPDRILVGPGDDCAVTRSASGDLQLITVDQLVAGRHFDPQLLATDAGIDRVARKAVARSISDIAAMGGTPAWSLATALVPERGEYADHLFDRMHHWAAHWHAPLIGGDIAAGPGPLALTVTVAGTMGDGHSPVLRSTAQPGHRVYVTGSIGDSLASGWHLDFEPRLDIGRAIAALAHQHGPGTAAMIDLSDGLGRDAARIGTASAVVLDIAAAAIPLREPSADPLAAAAEGEDYELLFTLAPERTPPPSSLPITRIGTTRAPRPNEPPGAIITDPAGTPHNATDFGWNHGDPKHPG